MAARWSIDEKQQLWDFISEEYIENDKIIHWNEVQTHMTKCGYQRTSEACRKKYTVILEEKAYAIQESNESLGSFASNLCESLKPMSESDWQLNENLHDTVSDLPEMEEILLEDTECEDKYSNSLLTVYENDIEDYYTKERNRILYVSGTIVIVIIFLLLYSLFTK